MYLRDSSLDNEIEFAFWKDRILTRNERFSYSEHTNTIEDVEKEGNIT